MRSPNFSSEIGSISFVRHFTNDWNGSKGSAVQVKRGILLPFVLARFGGARSAWRTGIQFLHCISQCDTLSLSPANIVRVQRLVRAGLILVSYSGVSCSSYVRIVRNQSSQIQLHVVHRTRLEIRTGKQGFIIVLGRREWNSCWTIRLLASRWS